MFRSKRMILSSVLALSMFGASALAQETIRGIRSKTITIDEPTPTPAPKPRPIAKPVAKPVAPPVAKPPTIAKPPPVAKPAPVIAPAAPKAVAPVAKPTPKPVIAKPAAPPSSAPLSLDTPVVAPPPPEAAVTAAGKAPLEQSYNAISISYHSWVEKMTLDLGGTDYVYATFAGTGFHYERQSFWGRTGVTTEVGLLTGAAAAGGTSTKINYTAPKSTYIGAQIALKAEHRTNPQLSFSLGPSLLYRSIKWSTESLPGLSATSGSDFNFALLGELRIRLNPSWDLRQQVGALAFNASTYWLLGLGYKF